MAAAGPQITLTTAKVGFFLSLVAVVTLGWNVFSYLKAGEIKDLQQDTRIERQEDASKRFETGINKLTDKTDELKEAMVRLTTVIEQTTPQKRASYEERQTPGLVWENIASGSK